MFCCLQFTVVLNSRRDLLALFKTESPIRREKTMNKLEDIHNQMLLPSTSKNGTIIHLKSLQAYKVPLPQDLCLRNAIPAPPPAVQAPNKRAQVLSLSHLSTRASSSASTLISNPSTSLHLYNDCNHCHRVLATAS